MSALLFLGIVFALASAVTFLALASAKDGYEDSSGFHHCLDEPALTAATRNSTRDPAPLPPLATTG